MSTSPLILCSKYCTNAPPEADSEKKTCSGKYCKNVLTEADSGKKTCSSCRKKKNEWNRDHRKRKRDLGKMAEGGCGDPEKENTEERAQKRTSRRSSVPFAPAGNMGSNIDNSSLDETYRTNGSDNDGEFNPTCDDPERVGGITYLQAV